MIDYNIVSIPMEAPKNRIFDRFDARKVEKIAAAALIAVGVLMRLRAFTANRSLWLDEAMLALNIAGRSFAELTQPLDFNQGAPLGFLLLQKTMIVLFGNQDVVLRMIPLAAGIGAVFLFRKTLPAESGAFGLVALALFAFSERLVYYSAEIKQYSSDVFFALLVTYAFLRCLRSNSGWREDLGLFLAGLIAIWISHPAVFVLGGCLIALALHAVRIREKGRFTRLVLLAAGLGINFGIIYWISLRHLLANEALIAYWQGQFSPAPISSDLAWYRNTALVLLDNPLGIDRILGGAAILIGLLGLAIKRNAVAAAILSGFCLLILASTREIYPLGQRLMLFSIPLFYFLAAEGLDFTSRLFARLDMPRFGVATALVAAYALLAMPLSTSIEAFKHPNMDENIKPLMAHMRESLQEGDAIYVYYGAIPAFTYYAPIYGLDDETIYFGSAFRETPESYLEEIDQIDGTGRVWFLLSHICPTCEIDERRYIIDYLSSIGERIEVLRQPYADLFLYDLGGE